MVLTHDLINKGFSLQQVNTNDLEQYINIKRACTKKYVDEYNGGWIEDIQIIINTERFHKMKNMTCFQKILLRDTTVGFFTFQEQLDKIGEISLQLIQSAKHKGMEAFYLKHITSLSLETGKPIFLYMYKSDPANDLFKEFGFKIYDQSRTHYFLSFLPKDTDEENHTYNPRSYMNRLFKNGSAESMVESS